jgi:hypothetical protein
VTFKKRWPLNTGDCLIEVTFKKRWPLNTGDCLIQVTVKYRWPLNTGDFKYRWLHGKVWLYTFFCRFAGQTFLPNNETFLPRFTLDTSRLVFPAVNAKESAYRTLLMKNTGTTPIFFDIQKDPNKYVTVLLQLKNRSSIH